MRYSSRLDVMDAVDSFKLARCQTQGHGLFSWVTVDVPLAIENGIGIVEE